MKRLDPAKHFTILTDRNQVFMGERVKMRQVRSVDEFYHEINISSIIDRATNWTVLYSVAQWRTYFGYCDMVNSTIKPL